MIKVVPITAGIPQSLTTSRSITAAPGTSFFSPQYDAPRKTSVIETYDAMTFCRALL